MPIFPNQRAIVFEPYDYFNFPLEVLKDMGLAEIRLYTYLFEFGRENRGSVFLSSAHFCKETGISMHGYREAFSNLVKSGYIVNLENNKYMFCPEKYKVTNEEWMAAVYDYIVNNYGRNKRTSLVPSEYRTYERELDIFPEAEESTEELVTKDSVTSLEDFFSYMDELEAQRNGR